MRIVPDMDGVIDRRLLVNFRVDPEIARHLVPPPFRVNVIKGSAIAGICLIRLTELRPRGLPRHLGITSESAAHRFAVVWETDDGHSQGHGVYIPRRDTDSRLSVLLGGRVFPGEHHRAVVDVREGSGRYAVDMHSADESNAVEVRAHDVPTLPSGSIFGDVEEASEFFRRDTLGYSHTREPGRYDGVELRAAEWRIDPLAVQHVRSSFFDDPTRFPPGSVEFDCALSMRRSHARWRSHPPLWSATRTDPAPANASDAARI
jgi:hypothetical protein